MPLKSFILIEKGGLITLRFFVIALTLVFSACSDSGSDSSVSNVENSAKCADVPENTFCDSRDGKVYWKVKIGQQVWMAENLSFYKAGSYCYDDNTMICRQYSRLYSWSSAIISCPDGWRLPSKSDYEALFKAVGGGSVAGRMLKSRSDWHNDGNGINEFGFKALPAGKTNDEDDYGLLNDEARFWTSTELAGQGQCYVKLTSDSDAVFFVCDGTNRDDALSVRCVEE